MQNSASSPSRPVAERLARGHEEPTRGDRVPSRDAIQGGSREPLNPSHDVNSVSTTGAPEGRAIHAHIKGLSILVGIEVCLTIIDRLLSIACGGTCGRL